MWRDFVINYRQLVAMTLLEGIIHTKIILIFKHIWFQTGVFLTEIGTAIQKNNSKVYVSEDLGENWRTLDDFCEVRSKRPTLAKIYPQDIDYLFFLLSFSDKIYGLYRVQWLASKPMWWKQNDRKMCLCGIPLFLSSKLFPRCCFSILFAPSPLTIIHPSPYYWVPYFIRLYNTNLILCNGDLQK